MLEKGTPKLARFLLVATVLSFAAVLLRDGFGVVTPVWPAVWAKSYNLTEFLGAAVCGLRAMRSSGPSVPRGSP